MIKLLDVNKTYKTRYSNVVALRDVNLSLPDTGMVFIVGKSGCGKTTLLNVLGGLDKFDSGE
ncbi:MAG: ATP-binding cassette domain-containing protein, partial [Christensenellaceae bacterium]|nr:ATP-binding cassette domain-containing protein [Christensenellaceae bacterium]